MNNTHMKIDNDKKRLYRYINLLIYSHGDSVVKIIEIPIWKIIIEYEPGPK